MTERFLPTALRRALEKAVKAARDVAEEGAADAVRRLGVAEATAPAHVKESPTATDMRRRLRAHARTLGDKVDSVGVHEVRHLVEATGYAQWHRRLFARFLAERGLLRHPEHGPVTLEDCEELAKLEGFADGWAAAETYGARMLPGVFLPDDPVLALELAPEHAQALRGLVDGLDAAIFQADDSLGWTYQFWRAAEKDRVNKAGEKIGARDLPAVTQLFTEPYMVKFLLHNTLGAWRAGKVLAAQPDLAADAADEATLRTSVSPPGYAFDMLRFVREGEDAPRWRPASGVFPGWPDAAAAIRALDPCCGSGHFLTEMLAILSALRADEEGLADAEAVAAVLRDNLFGLELDGRCVQIAAFAVALTAWRIGGFQPFGPEQVHIAWVGAPPPLDRSEFMALGDGDQELREALAGLHDLFAQAPLLGSLIDPRSGDLMSPQRLGRIEPLLDRLVEKTRAAEPERSEGAVAARGMADAAANLSRQYTLVATNVPFLGRGKQTAEMVAFVERYDSDTKTDLATTMLSRAKRLVARGGTVSAVTPQSWLFNSGYRDFRVRLLREASLNLVGALGSRAFETISGEVVNTSLIVFSTDTPLLETTFAGIDVNDAREAAGKQNALPLNKMEFILQTEIASSDGSVVSVTPRSEFSVLARFVDYRNGLQTGDYPRLGQAFWEQLAPSSKWTFFQTTVKNTSAFGGMSGRVAYDSGSLASLPGATVRGAKAWGRRGVAISAMGQLCAARYEGALYDDNTVCLIPHDEEMLPAIWAFCSDANYSKLVRKKDRSLKVRAGLVNVPFDASHWKSIAAARYPNGFPEPYSNDPTQWVFHGHPAQAEAGTQLHVALARLAGYRWPAESDPEIHVSVEARGWVAKAATLPEPDADGVLPLPAAAGDRPLADRLRDFLNIAMPGWDEASLVRAADELIDRRATKDLSLEAWLRDRAFRQHATLFHNRPFLWQVCDGQKDGFSAFMHYHRLDAAKLGKLTYTVLGDWIARMTNSGDARRIESAKILQQKLTAILGGEAPLDIFVRWKTLDRQPVGWDPDFDDGVRLNIRPFVEAGVLRETPKIKWGVDRGSDAPSAPWFPHDKGKRNNDRHLSLADKHAARGAR